MGKLANKPETDLERLLSLLEDDLKRLRKDVDRLNSRFNYFESQIVEALDELIRQLMVDGKSWKLLMSL